MSQASFRNIHLDEFDISTPSWVHPEYEYWATEWKLIRDAFLGEKEVKSNGTAYLPRLSGQSKDDYFAFVRRATFTNFTARTSRALMGTIFRRSPVVSGVPENRKEILDNFTDEHQTFFEFEKAITREVVMVGRCGVLVDVDPAGVNLPYGTLIIAENIMDWQVELINGRMMLTDVVIRELRLERTFDINRGLFRESFVAYRRLVLQPNEETGQMEYRQILYEAFEGDADLKDSNIVDEITPTQRGVPLDHIPFRFFGSFSHLPSIEPSPLYDIARMNMSHYRTSALLKHGLFFVGLPIYWAEVGNTAEGGDYRIGPSVVWEIEKGCKAGIMEFNGQGLGFMFKSLDKEEQDIATLGGRIIGVRGTAVSESDNQVALSQRNETAVLLDITQVMDAGMTWILKQVLRWADVPENLLADVGVEFNKDFLIDQKGAREFRAVQAMYKDGLLPVEVFYDYMRKAEVIPEFLDIDEFKALLENQAAFPAQPDVHARQDGFPDKKTQLDEENREEDIEREEERAAQAARAGPGAGQEGMTPAQIQAELARRNNPGGGNN